MDERGYKMKYVDIDTAVEVLQEMIGGRYADIAVGGFRAALEANEIDFSEIGDCDSCASADVWEDEEPCDTCTCVGNTGGNHWRPKKGSR
jgi:hypothetical protein